MRLQIFFLDEKLIKYCIKINCCKQIINASDESWGENVPQNSVIAILGFYDQFKYELIEKFNKLLQMRMGNLYYLVPFERKESANRKKRILNTSENKVLDALYFNPSEEEIKKILEKKYKNLIIAAHGEGQHLKLGEVVVCSADKNVSNNYKENTSDCSNSYCRKTDNIGNRIFCENIIADNIFLLSCNSGCVAGELFPSDNNLIKGFLNGQTHCIMGCMELHDYLQEDIFFLNQLVINRFNVLEICQIFNDIEYSKTNRLPFVCFALNTNVMNCRKRDFKTCYLGKEIEMEENKTEVFFFEEKKEFYTLYLNEDSKVQVKIGQKFLIICNISIKTKVFILDGTEQLKKIYKLIYYLMDILEKWFDYFEMVDRKNVLKEIVYDKGCEVKKIKLKMAQIERQRVCENNCMKDITKKLENIGHEIQIMLIRYFYSEKKLFLYEQLRFEGTIRFLKSTDRCNRCNNKLYMYKIEEYIQSNRIMEMCPLCGMRSLVMDGVKLKSQVVKRKSKESEYNIEINIEHKIDSPLKTICYLEISDKARKIITQKFVEVISISKDKISIEFEKGLLKGQDLHTYRGIIFIGLIPNYFKGRIAC